jgi:hypothetical protein
MNVFLLLFSFFDFAERLHCRKWQRVGRLSVGFTLPFAAVRCSASHLIFYFFIFKIPDTNLFGGNSYPIARSSGKQVLQPVFIKYFIV